MDLDAFFGGIVLPEKWRVLEQWDEYIRMIERVEALPENQSGSDKSGVERAERTFLDHYKTVRRS
jgi:hypothetical protein